MADNRKATISLGELPILALVVLTIGVVGSLWCPNALGQRFSEALIIAGVLAIAVDPFLKRRLQREVSRDIFHHLIGFSLPREIQDRIKEIVLDTKLYRRNMDLTCTFSRVPEGVRIDCEYKFDLVNPSSEKAPFKQRLEFEKHENATLKSISCSDKSSDYGKAPKLMESKEDPDVRFFEGPIVKIPPEQGGHNISFRAEYSIVRPVPAFHVQHFVLPTTGLTLILKSPPDLKVTASPADAQPRADEWIYKRLFMPGEHLEIRWEDVKQSIGD